MMSLGFKGTGGYMWCEDVFLEMGTKYRHHGEGGFKFCKELMHVDNSYPFSTARVFIVQYAVEPYPFIDQGGVTKEMVLLEEITAAKVHDLMAAPRYKSLMSENTVGVLMLFAARDDAKTLHGLLDQYVYARKNVDHVLVFASTNGYKSAVPVLLDFGANVHADSDRAWEMVNLQHTNTVALLLTAGANVHTNNDFALKGASIYGYTDTVRLLLEHGADVHAGNDASLIGASRCGHTDTVAVLLHHGANVHALEDSALKSAGENGYCDVVRLLLEHGADVHADNDFALRWASANGHLRVVSLLLVAGADVHADNDYALRFASERRHTSVVTLLLEHGANFPSRCTLL